MMFGQDDFAKSDVVPCRYLLLLHTQLSDGSGCK